MKENMIRIAAATTLGFGAWFAHNYEFQRSSTNITTQVSSENNTKIVQNSINQPEFEPRIPKIVTRVNAAIDILESCPDPLAKESAKKFITINRASKIAMAYGNEIGDSSIGVEVLTNDKNNFDIQIGISPQNILDTSLGDEEIAFQMLKTILIIDTIKELPEKYENDVYFKSITNQNADTLSKKAICAK